MNQMNSGWSLLLLRFLWGVLDKCFTLVIRFTLNGFIRDIVWSIVLGDVFLENHHALLLHRGQLLGQDT